LSAGATSLKKDCLEKWTPRRHPQKMRSATENLSAFASSLKKDWLEKWTPRLHPKK
jgi:hypothetical protein